MKIKEELLDCDTIKTYIFEDEKQKAFFMKGVEEANGWLEYEVVDMKGMKNNIIC